MERRQEIQRTVFTAVAVDIAVILIFVVAWLNKPHDLVVFATICFPTLFIFNFLFLRRKLKRVGPPAAEQGTRSSPRFSVYACSAIFFVGTLYGVLMIAQGDLPRMVSPLLLVPLSLAVYCLKTARRAGNSELDEP